MSAGSTLLGLEVLEPGLLTTIQDAGRPEWTHLGVPIGGACDRWSLAVANVLVANDAATAALEMTITGPVLAIREELTVGLAGADLGAVVRETGEELASGRSHRLARGSTLAFAGTAELASGCRAYLAVAGGFDVPRVLGSASTLASAGLGGVEGRPLRAGDVLVPRLPAAAPEPRAWPILNGDPFGSGDESGTSSLGLLAGLHDGGDALVRGEWRAAAGSNRIGVRLEGATIDGARGEVVSHGVVTGAVQLPPDGDPIVLLAEHQTTGGYPVIGVVMSADHPRLGQLRPGSTVRFRSVTAEQAREALIRQRAAFAEAAATLGEAERWDAIWQSAGG
jgi:antagonist of KipI